MDNKFLILVILMFFFLSCKNKEGFAQKSSKKNKKYKFDPDGISDFIKDSVPLTINKVKNCETLKCESASTLFKDNWATVCKSDKCKGCKQCKK